MADHLDALLPEQRRDVAVIDLSSADAVFLAEYSGVPLASEADLARLDAQSATRAAAEAARALSRSNVARLLGVDPSRVSHQVAAGKLYSFPGNGRPVFPDWQFTARHDHQTEKMLVTTIPHSAAVIAAIPVGSHPIAVRTFMTTPSQDLRLQGTAMSPRDWLIGGGNPTAEQEWP